MAVSPARGAIHSTKIQTGPTGKRGPPQKVDQFFRNFSGWTEPIHRVLDRNVRKLWLNGSRPWTLHARQEYKLDAIHMRCLRRLLNIKRQDKVMTNNDVLERANLPSIFSL